MYKKRLQNKVAESRMALPLAAVYALGVCFACGLAEHRIWIPFSMLAVSSYLMMVLNNANALIRIYSRMVSCSFLVLAVMSCFLMDRVESMAVQLCFVAFYVFLFRAYQDKRSMGLVFYSFAMLGIASTMFVQVLYFVPIIWILLYTNITAGCGRTFLASLLGLVAPYWFVAGYNVYQGKGWWVLSHFEGLAKFAPVADFSVLDAHQCVAFAFVAVLALTGMVHFHRNSYKDKIRVRLLFEVFSIMCGAIFVFFVLQPQHCNYLLGMLIVSASPLVGHYVALTKTWLTNASFIVFCLAALSITFWNVWIR